MRGQYSPELWKIIEEKLIRLGKRGSEEMEKYFTKAKKKIQWKKIAFLMTMRFLTLLQRYDVTLYLIYTMLNMGLTDKIWHLIKFQF